MTASVAVANVIAAADVAASLAVSIGRSSRRCREVSVMQTAPTASSSATRRQWFPTRLAQKFEALGLFVASLIAVVTVSLEPQRRRHS